LSIFKSPVALLKLRSKKQFKPKVRTQTKIIEQMDFPRVKIQNTSVGKALLRSNLDISDHHEKSLDIHLSLSIKKANFIYKAISLFLTLQYRVDEV